MANLALFVQCGNNVTLVHARMWLNGESCVNDGKTGSNSSTVAAMSDDSGVLGCRPVVAVVEVVTLEEVVSMVAMVAKVAVFAMVEEVYGSYGSDDSCSSAVTGGEAMMAVVRCNDGSCNHLSGGDGCISAM